MQKFETLTAVAAPIVSRDVDTDQDIDLVVANYQAAGTISVLRNNGDGTFASPVAYPAGPFPTDIAVISYSAPRVVVTNESAGTVSVLASRSDGSSGTAAESTGRHAMRAGATAAS